MPEQHSIEERTESLVESLGRLIRRVRAAAPPGISLTEWMVLSQLAREGATTSAALARDAAMRPQSMGTTIASLEQRGLVERTPHPTDGRQVLIAITPLGSALRDGTRAAKRTWILEAIGRLSPEEQETLFAAGELIGCIAGGNPS